MTDPSDPRPPQVVANADSPESTLALFIAKELEHWGFEIVRNDDPSSVVLSAESIAFEVEVWRLTDSGRERYGL